MRRIYLAHNASTPLDPRVAAAMRRALEEPYGNPSSPHWAGAPARRVVDAAPPPGGGPLGGGPPAIVSPCRFLERLGAGITSPPVDRSGRKDPEDLRHAMTSDTLLVSV